MFQPALEFFIHCQVDAPLNFLKDLNASPKVKTTEVEGVGIHSVIHNISKVRWVCWNFGMGIRTSDKWVNYSYGPAQTNQQVG
jgi:hypothetical protein